MQIQFAHDVFAMAADGLLGDIQRLGDLFIAGAFGQMRQYFLFAFGQPIEVVGCGLTSPAR